MIGGLVLMTGLMLASAGIALLLWLLWILWKFKTVEPEPPASETGESATTEDAEIATDDETELAPTADSEKKALQDTIDAEQSEE